MRVFGTAVTFAVGLAISLVATGGVNADTITDLGPGQALGINASGQVVGYSVVAGGADNAFLYSGGVLTDLGTFGGANGQANAINDAGVIVGESFATPANPESGANAILYSGGVATNLGPGTAAAINDAGQVVGQSNVAFLYSGGAITNLGTLGGSFSGANGINATGQIVGSATTANQSNEAFLYSGGVMTGIAGTYNALSINAFGQVVGYVEAAGTPFFEAFLYSNGTVTNLGTLTGGINPPVSPLNPQGSQANGINDLGEIVGASFVAGPGQDAFLYYGGIMTDLNSLLPANSGWRLEDATAINGSGQIVGYGLGPDGQQDAFLLDTGSPTPEPESLVLFGSGAALLALMRKRFHRQPMV